MSNTDLIRIFTDGPFETNEKKLHWTGFFYVLNSFYTAFPRIFYCHACIFLEMENISYKRAEEMEAFGIDLIQS